MSEAPVTRQQLQDAVEDLQSAMSNEVALQDAINKEFKEAVAELNDLPTDVTEQIIKLWKALGEMNDMSHKRYEAHIEIHKSILGLIRHMITSSAHGGGR